MRVFLCWVWQTPVSWNELVNRLRDIHKTQMIWSQTQLGYSVCRETLCREHRGCYEAAQLAILHLLICLKL
jgi:hypothetical protein